MGAASYREDIVERRFAAAGPPVVTEPLPYSCPFCHKRFNKRRRLTEHLASEHRGEHPFIRLRGQELGARDVVRRRLVAADVEVQNCTSLSIRRNGMKLSDSNPNCLPGLFAGETNADLELELLNRFDRIAEPVTRSYRLTICVAEKSALDAVDDAFLECLGLDSPDMSHVRRFLDDYRTQGLVRDYADALAAYVRGVLVKDGRGGATLPPKEAVNLQGEALQTLQDFDRPLSVAVCSLLRFAANDFSQADEPAGLRLLDRCHAALAPALGHAPPIIVGDYDGTGNRGGRSGLIPFDTASELVFDLAERGRAGPVVLSEYRNAVEEPGLTARDRVKVRALWALAASGAGMDAEALEPLRQLRNDPAFGKWASGELERLHG